MPPTTPPVMDNEGGSIMHNNNSRESSNSSNSSNKHQHWPPWRRSSLFSRAGETDEHKNEIPLQALRASGSRATSLVPVDPAHTEEADAGGVSPPTSTSSPTSSSSSPTARTTAQYLPDPLSWPSTQELLPLRLSQHPSQDAPGFLAEHRDQPPSHTISSDQGSTAAVRNQSDHESVSNKLTAGVFKTRLRADEQEDSQPASGTSASVWPPLFAKRQLSDGGLHKPAGEYMRGIEEAARAWSARALTPGVSGGWSGGGGVGSDGGGGEGRRMVDGLDPVAMWLLPETGEQRVGGPSGRGPLLRRLQTEVPGMLDDFVVVTITRPGPLYVRLKPDPRGLVIVNNFDPVPDDPITGCPQLGPVEIVGTVMPGDSLASANREVLLGRPFSDCVKCIREASASATLAKPCLLCFRKADPSTLEASMKAAPPRSLEQEKRRTLEMLLLGGEDGIVDEARLRGITSTGVPDAGGLRPVLWRFLLRCLPSNRRQWAERLQEQRALYARFIDDLILEPAKKVTRGGSLDSVGCGNPDKVVTRVAKTGSGKSGTADDPTATVEAAEIVTRGPLAGSRPVDNLCTAENGMERALHKGDIYRERHSCTHNPSSVPCDAHKSASVAAILPIPSTAATAQPRRCSSGNPGLRPTDDDPLSDKESSEWAALWSDKELMQAINQDVVRTLPFLAFYAGGGGSGDRDRDSRSNGSASTTRSEKHRLGRERHHSIARILFVHAKLNPAESYTQGMNEIVGTLFFVMGNDAHEEWNMHAEADTFFCFTNLMAEIRDVFIQSLDESETGLQGKMEAFSRTLQQHDPELADHMVSLALDPRYFALRWFTTLLCREFDLPDTIRLWDSLFASRDRSNFLVFVFVTLLLAQREALLEGDFASNLQLLQAYPPTDVPEILARSEALRLFSARGDAARTGLLTEQRAREAADGAKAAAEHVNAAARRLWNAATDFATEVAVGAAEKMAGLGEGQASPNPSVDDGISVIEFTSDSGDLLLNR